MCINVRRKPELTRGTCQAFNDLEFQILIFPKQIAAPKKKYLSLGY